MSDIVERLRCFSKNTPWAIEDRVVLKEAADEIDKLCKEIALADSVYKLVVLERDAAREYLDAAQRRGEGLREQVVALQNQVIRLTKILDDAGIDA